MFKSNISPGTPFVTELPSLTPSIPLETVPETQRQTSRPSSRTSYKVPEEDDSDSDSDSDNEESENEEGEEDTIKEQITNTTPEPEVASPVTSKGKEREVEATPRPLKRISGPVGGPSRKPLASIKQEEASPFENFYNAISRTASQNNTRPSSPLQQSTLTVDPEPNTDNTEQTVAVLGTASAPEQNHPEEQSNNETASTAQQDHPEDHQDNSGNPDEEPSDIEIDEDDMAEKDTPMGKPLPFSGDRKTAKSWLIDVKLYLSGHPERIKTDQDRVRTALSFIKGEPAHTWKNNFVDDGTDEEGNIDLGKWTDFCKKFQKSWFPSDAQGNATAQMHDLTMIGTKMSVDDYINKFKTLAGASGITEFNALKIFFENGLIPNLVTKIHDQGTDIEDMEDYYSKVSQADAKWRRGQNVIRRAQGKPPLEEPKSYFATPSQTITLSQGIPMDIDAVSLSNSKRAELMRAGKCFTCEQKGHLFYNCPNAPKGRKGGFQNKPKRTNVRAIELDMSKPEVLIRAIGALSEDNRNKFWDQAQKAGQESDGFFGTAD